MSSDSYSDLFDRTLSFPDPSAVSRFHALVGIDSEKEQLTKLLCTLVAPAALTQWAKSHLNGNSLLVDMVRRRPPLVIIAGDVGTGKTALAETVGDKVARDANIEITLFPLSLSARGTGRVGEMTKLISDAFDIVWTEAKKLTHSGGQTTGGVLLLIDEADALAQSREESQMHHEDRAGVNALIRGIDRLAADGLPAAVLMCTNRLSAIDPAVQRRAAQIFRFTRPSDEQRAAVLVEPLRTTGLAEEVINEIVSLTGPQGEKRSWGFTYSDIVQRLLPEMVLTAFPNNAITRELALTVTQRVEPTPPFKDGE